jgi:alpha-tubulin suppressor-like RCC1 family protein
VYTWGENANFTLGHEKEQRKRVPERIEFFSRHCISIKQVLMCKYHSVFLSNAGHVYTCGHGRNGRLGHGNEQTLLVPKMIEAVKQEECIQLSASTDHTVMLMQSGKAFSCGLNNYFQLGHSATGSSLTPKMMNSKC